MDESDYTNETSLCLTKMESLEINTNRSKMSQKRTREGKHLKFTPLWIVLDFNKSVEYESFNKLSFDLYSIDRKLEYSYKPVFNQKIIGEHSLNH